MPSFGHVSREDITILRVAWPGATERPLACWLSPGPTSLFPLHTTSTSTLWTTFLCLFSCSCVRMLFPFSCKCLLHGWWSSDAYGEVNAVGQWKPISCGEPTSVQDSVVDNREFVVHGIAASECRTGCMMSADTVILRFRSPWFWSSCMVSQTDTSSLLVPNAFLSAVPAGWMVRRPVLKSLQLQYRERLHLLSTSRVILCFVVTFQGPKTSQKSAS